MSRGTKYRRGPPKESHIFYVTVFPVNQYREAQLKIILNIYNKGTTYTGVGQTDDFQYVYVFIADCATPVPDLPEATGDWVG